MKVPVTVVESDISGMWLAQICGCQTHAPFNALFAWGATATEAKAGLASLVWLVVESPLFAEKDHPTAVVFDVVTAFSTTETFPHPSIELEVEEVAHDSAGRSRPGGEQE